MILVTAVLGPSPAGADISGIRVTGQSAFVAPNGSFVVEITIDGANDQDPTALAELTFAVTVFDRMLSESELDEAPSRAASSLEPVSLADLTATEPGIYRLEIPIRSGEPIDEMPRLQLSDAGVYPVTIELRDPEGVVATTRTNLIRLAPNVAEEGDPLLVAIVLPVVPAEGVTVVDAEQLLASHPDLPLTVLLDSGVVSQLTDDPTLAAGFADALGDRPLVATPSIDLDPSALAAIDRIDLYHDALADTVAQLQALNLNPVANTAVITEQLTRPGAEALVAAGVEVVIDASSSPAPNGYLSVGGRRLHLLRYDGPVSSIFGEPSTAVSQANEVLARLGRAVPIEPVSGP